MDLLQLQRDPAAFRRALLIDTDAGPKPFDPDPWQEADFAALDSGWKRAVVGSTQEATHQRGWLERPRGHSKSADLGVMAAWALFASRRRLSGIAAAGDQDQARLLRDAIGRLTYFNPWLGHVLEVQNYRVVNKATESTLEVISSDAPTSYGLTPDFVIADEITHWAKRDLWDALITSAAKRSTCMFVVICNAGFTDDWVWETREAIRRDPAWFFNHLEEPMASWITPEALEEQRRITIEPVFKRLWLNQWSSGMGDAVSEDDLEAAFDNDFRPLQRGIPGWDYVAGLDLGVARHASAVCVLGVRRGHDQHGRIRLAHTKVWKPTKDQKVNLQDVEDWLQVLHQRFNFKQLNADPYEARHMMSRLQAGGLGRLDRPKSRLPIVEVTQTPKNLQLMATTLIEAFNDRRVECYRDADLKTDLRRLRVEQKQYGFRLVSPENNNAATGTPHGDLGSAFCLAMLAAADLAAKRRISVTGNGSYTNQTAFQQAVRAFEREQELYAQEQAVMRQPDDPEEAFKQIMQIIGRYRP